MGDFVGEREPVSDFTVQFRAAIATIDSQKAQDELQKAVDSFQRLCEDYLHLEKLNEAPLSHNYPPQYETSGTSPEDAAEDVASSERNRLGLGDGPLLNLREALENDIGLRIFSIELPSRVAGMFSYTEKLGGCIAVNARHPHDRQRWSLAHEYGHFLTSRFRSEVSMLGGYGRSRTGERFADTFARCLLMPAAGLRRRFNEESRAADGKITATEICRLAYHFFVSVEAMMLRLEELRLLKGGTWELLRDRGFKVREAQELLGLSPHPHDRSGLPLRYQFLAALAYEKGELTEGELARILHGDRVAARRTVQKLTQSLLLNDEGQVTSFSIELAQGVSGMKEPGPQKSEVTGSFNVDRPQLAEQYC
ncbi:MAG: ImmA/IrrE family metallo-endopeptidase [Caldilineaceae bacterium]|nr:ImmA/IrrE family metallo-endopeptidase [Caldilineaceae bacterium]